MFRISKFLAVLLWSVPLGAMDSRLNQNWSFKPPVGTTVNWGHPLSKNLIGCWLFNEGGGSQVFDLARPGSRAVLSTPANPVWVNTQIGPGVQSATGSNYLQENFPNTAFPITIVVLASLADLVNTQNFFSHDDGATGVGYFINAQGAPYVLQLTIQGVNHYRFTNFVPVVNQLYFFAVTCDKNGGTTTGYWAKPGQSLQVQSVALGSLGNTSSKVGFGGFSGTAQGTQTLAAGYFWNRVLTLAELQQLNANPYVFLTPPRPRNSLWFPSPATTNAVARQTGLIINGVKTTIRGAKVIIR